jgi:hypothetical protein
VDPRVLVDDGLEFSIVGSFSRIGPAVRRRLFRWASPRPGALVGQTVLVTGPTSGLGRETAGAMAELGARVVLVGEARSALDGLCGATATTPIGRRSGLAASVRAVAAILDQRSG